MMDQDELIGVFIEESMQHLESIEPDLLEMEKDIDNIDSEIVNGIFRAVHSIKGASGFFGFQKIGELSHIMENLLSLLREGKMKASSELIDALFAGVDALRAMFDDVTTSDQFDIQTEIDQLANILNPVEEPSKIVTVKEKLESGKQAKTFDIQESKLDRFTKNGQFLYTITVYLKKDLTDKGRTPLDLINAIVSTGELIESRLGIEMIQGLSDCLENEITFVFAFATILEEDLIPVALDIPQDRVIVIDIEAHKQKYGPDSVKDLVSKKMAKVKKPEPVSKVNPEKDPVIKKESSKTVLPKKQKKTSTEPELKISHHIQTEEKIKVGVNFLNDLVNLAGEMVLGRNQLNQIAMPLVKDAPGLNPAIQHISRITTEMQEKIMQMRMQPVSMIFGKFQRIVRDLAKNLNKDIKLVIYGEDVELDRSIIEALSDPLTHLIRNSVDHGIESSEDREKFGKPKKGTIELKAYHQAGHVYIDIIDDGGGIDCPWIGEKAVEKGLITKEQMKEMGEKELAKLIFKPGFSTAKQVSSVSGRGVGMDVVLTNINQLGGTVDIDTTLYEGTTISLVLPLTLAIVSGLVICTGEQFFVLPEANIDELVRIKPDEIENRINFVQNSRVLRLRDMLLPLISLADVLLGLNQDQAGSSTLENRIEPVRVLVIKHGTSRFGLMVDAVENIEEIVVKPLPRYLKNQKCFSGASIMGNGSISLILDVVGLFEKAGLHHIDLKKQNEKTRIETRKDEKDLQTLLLFSNNTSEKFALPLELITRIERVKSSSIEKVKGQQYLQYQGDKLRLIYLEDYLPVEQPDRSKEDTICVIVPKLMKHPLGIVISAVEGTIQTIVDIDTKSIMSPGLFGSAILKDKITLFPDMYTLFELAAPEWYGSEPVSKNHGTTSKRILLVEDTPFFRMVEKDYLVSSGYEVLEAENGRQALAILAEEPVDAVILDIIMPEMDGWETIRAIRSNNRLKDLPVMAVTSLADDIDAKKGLEEGFTQWEAKLNKERLLEKLSRMLTLEKEAVV